MNSNWDINNLKMSCRRFLCTHENLYFWSTYFFWLLIMPYIIVLWNWGDYRWVTILLWGTSRISGSSNRICLLLILVPQYTVGARGSIVGWGTMLQARRSWVRVPMRCFFFFNLPNPSSRTMALGSTQPLTEMSPTNLPGGKERPVLKADNFIAIYEPIVCKMWEPQRLSTLWVFTACYRDSFTFFTFTTVHNTVNSPLSGMYGEWSVLLTLICQLHQPKFSHFSGHFHSLFLDQNIFSPSCMGVLSDTADWQVKYFGHIMCTEPVQLPTASAKSYTSTLTYIFMARCLIKQGQL
jgi:hypothetical protein